MPIRDSGCRSGDRLASRVAHMPAHILPTCRRGSAIKDQVGHATKPAFYTSRWRGPAKIFAGPASLAPRNRYVVDVTLDFPPRAGT